MSMLVPLRPGAPDTRVTRTDILAWLRATYCVGLPHWHRHVFMKDGKVWFEAQHQGVG